MRIALIHDWLVSMRGGEKVVDALLGVFPNADLFTLVACPDRLSGRLAGKAIRTTSLQHWPMGRSHYRWFLPLFDRFMSEFDLSGYDLVVSTNTACAKWVRVPQGVSHVCYCNTPMRYVWDLFDDYFGKAPLPVRVMARLFRKRLQEQDLRSNEGVTHFIANSREIQERITRLYGRDSTVIHPPVDIGRFSARTESPRGDAPFLVVSALVPYKRVDLAVQACNRLCEPLLVVGEGGELRRLRAMAGPSVRFQGWVSDRDLPELYRNARALLFPGREDFGIVPVEAAASGCPVIAYKAGGALDTMQEGVTGTFFNEQAMESLVDAMRRFAGMKLDATAMQGRAQAFSGEEFERKIREYFNGKYRLGL
jgi:glycosyltransferase involved in cell wall biosynthesis